MFSFVTKMSLLANRAVLLEILIPPEGLIVPNVDILIVEADPTGISAKLKKTFFFYKLLHFFS